MIKTHDRLYDYVHAVATECAPDYDFFEEDMPQTESIVGHDFLRGMDKMSFPFTKEHYLKNHEIGIPN